MRSLRFQHVHDNRQELPRTLSPALKHGDPAARLCSLARRELRYHLPYLPETVLAVFDLRHDLVLQETNGQMAQFGHRLVVCRATAGQGDRPDGANFPEKVQTLAGGSSADTQPRDQIIHRHGLPGQEKQSIELRVGPWLPNDPRNLNEQADHLRFQAAPGLAGSRLTGFGRHSDWRDLPWHRFISSRIMV